MSTALKTKPHSITARVRNIRAEWGVAERLQRAAVGHRRRNELMQRVLGGHDEAALWAVGSLTSDDLARMAG